MATYAKMGTTWTQMLCALLVHGPKLPGPLAEISPWLDGGAWDYNENAVDVFNAQPFRRIIKTHTPLHALKHREDAFYVTCGRDPRDAFLSSLDHGDNSALGDRAKATPDRNEAFEAALDFDNSQRLSSLFDHVDSFWTARGTPNILFLHYEDLCDDLHGEATRLAAFLGLTRSPREIDTVVEAARFDAMRADADDLAPGAKVEGRWKRNADFFRKARRGEWRDLITSGNQARYTSITRSRFDHTMLDRLENGRHAAGDPALV